MKTNSPEFDEQNEARITALLLGELSPAEEADLKSAIPKNPELALLHARIAQTIALLGKTLTENKNAPAVEPPEPKLSEGRRQLLLRQFRTVAPEEFKTSKSRGIPWFVPMGIAATLIGLLVFVGFGPAFKTPEMEQLARLSSDVSLRYAKKDELSDRNSNAEPVAAVPPQGLSQPPREESAKSGLEEQRFSSRDLSRSKSLRTLKEALPSEPGKTVLSVAGVQGGSPPSEPVQTAASRSSGRVTISNEKRPGEVPDFQKPSQAGPQSNAGLAVKPSGASGNRGFDSGGIAGAVDATWQDYDNDAYLDLFAAKTAASVNKPSEEFGRSLVELGDQVADFKSKESADDYSKNANLATINGSLANNQTAVVFDSGLNDQGVARSPGSAKPGLHNDGAQFGLTFKEQKDSRDLDQKAEAGSASAPGVQTMPGLKTSIAPLVQDARLLMETGKLDEAEAKLKQAVKEDPENQGASYYQKLLAERRYQREARKREIASGEAMLTVERSWNPPSTEPKSPPSPISENPLRQKARLSEQIQGPNELERLGKQIGGQDKSQSGVVELRSETRSANEASPLLKSRFAKEEPVNRQPPAGTTGRPVLTEQKAQLVEGQADMSQRRHASPPAIPQPEVESVSNPFSTFSLNVTDVSFKLAAASLEKGLRPDPATIRSEEFVNAFNYRDPEAASGVPIAFASDRAQYPFAHNRDILRLSVRTAAKGREAARPLNLVLLLDNSGSMERADRVHIIHEALAVLARQLQPQDRISVVTFARTARLWIDGLSGDKAGEISEQVGGLAPEGGTNLEEALNLAYATAVKHFSSNSANRVVLMTDGAANLGDVSPDSLKQKVESWRRRGIALDCFGIGWEGFNDDLLEVLSRNGDGRYGFVNTPEEASTEFAAQLAGALQVAASDVKVQVEFNPQRVTAWRQIGYAKHQLTKEQFRDNTVDAAELAAAETGNALYVVQVDATGNGAIGTVRVRYREPNTGIFREQAWPIPYNGTAPRLDQAPPSLRLATTASAFSEWLASSPFAGEVTPDALLPYMQGVPAAFDPDPRPSQLEWMIHQAKSVFGQ
jgi:Mg-chelatase subunit ChlD